MPVHMWWLNAGVAPIYRDYKLALHLQSSAGNAILQVPATLTEWLPGDAVVDQSLYIPEDLPPGTYKVRVGILDPQSGKPAIRLGIEGRQEDGWYDLGTVVVIGNAN